MLIRGRFTVLRMMALVLDIALMTSGARMLFLAFGRARPIQEEQGLSLLGTCLTTSGVIGLVLTLRREPTDFKVAHNRLTRLRFTTNDRTGIIVSAVVLL